MYLPLVYSTIIRWCFLSCSPLVLLANPLFDSWILACNLGSVDRVGGTLCRRADKAGRSRYPQPHRLAHPQCACQSSVSVFKRVVEADPEVQDDCLDHRMDELFSVMFGIRKFAQPVQPVLELIRGRRTVQQFVPVQIPSLYCGRDSGSRSQEHCVFELRLDLARDIGK